MRRRKLLVAGAGLAVLVAAVAFVLWPEKKGRIECERQDQMSASFILRCQEVRKLGSVLELVGGDDEPKKKDDLFV